MIKYLISLSPLPECLYVNVHVWVKDVKEMTVVELAVSYGSMSVQWRGVLISASCVCVVFSLLYLVIILACKL